MKTLALIFCIILTSCASLENLKDRYANRIDPGCITNYESYLRDYETCCSFAQAEVNRATNEAVGKAIFGALLGAAVGAVSGGIWAPDYKGQLAASGAMYGGLAGAGSAQNYADIVFWNCMRNRGYVLLW